VLKEIIFQALLSQQPKMNRTIIDFGFDL